MVVTWWIVAFCAVLGAAMGTNRVVLITLTLPGPTAGVGGSLTVTVA